MSEYEIVKLDTMPIIRYEDGIYFAAIPYRLDELVYRPAWSTDGVWWYGTHDIFQFDDDCYRAAVAGYKASITTDERKR